MIRILELFGGIGACTKAMERLGIEHEIADYVEIDKYAVKSFNALHDTNYEPQDICEWDKDMPVDFIMHGSPCQDFSIAGKQAGGDEGSGTRSSLLYETLRIVEKTRPKVVLWENVKNLLSAKHKPNWEKYCKRMEELGYRNYAKVLNAKDYGIPQNRERVYTMSIRNDIPGPFKFPEPEPLTKKLKDVLETDVDEKYYIKDATSLTVGTNFDTINGGAIGKMHDISRRAYHEDAIAPAMHTCGGGNTEPKIVARTDAHQKGGVYDSSSISPTITATTYKQPTQVATDTTLRSGRQGLKVTVSREISKTIRTGGRGSLDKHTWDLIAEPKVVASRGRYNEDGDIEQHLEPRKDGMRIRKLTPKECWRLMGFDDADFEKAEKVNSNTQLYKQAGNSIVVNVLEKILANLPDGAK